MSETKASGAAAPPRADGELPYIIELWDTNSAAKVERVLARALYAGLAREIFSAVRREHPERRITLRKGSRFVADSSK